MDAALLTDAQRDVQDLVRAFAEGEIAPHTADWDRQHHVSTLTQP